MITTDRLHEIIAPAVQALGLELYGCEYHAHKNTSTLIVYIDSQNGVTVDDCTKASRQIGAVLDVEDPIAGHYSLEVSSPGMNRPLFTLPHYERVIGEKVKLRLRTAKEGRRNFDGLLKVVAGDKLTILLDDNDELIVDFAEIDQAKLIPDF